MTTIRNTPDDYYFDLPQELIAQAPAGQRDASRLMVIDRSRRTRVHTVFARLPEYLRPGDLMVFNDAKVIGARIRCRRPSGGMLELLMTRAMDDGRWLALCNRTRRVRPGEDLRPIGDCSISLRVSGRIGDELILEPEQPLTWERIDEIGEVALPPYIRREPLPDDRARYQTVFARRPGAVAAPTAGMHFTGKLLDEIRENGVETTSVTLYVSWGTFQPVRAAVIDHHRMHAEHYLIEARAAELINAARGEGRRVIAVGTTSLRVLETTFNQGANIAGEGETDLFIHPPMKVGSVDALLTNFHTPRSTLLMLVASFAGYEFIMDSYREAVAMKYRFFSYGDAMLIV